MKRVATYIHHATDGDWLNWQPKMLQDYVSKQGGTLIDSYVEIGYADRNRRRPILEKLIADCESGKYDELAILRQSHLSRDTDEALKIYERLHNSGVGLAIMQIGTSDRVDKTMQLLKAVQYGA